MDDLVKLKVKKVKLNKDTISYTADVPPVYCRDCEYHWKEGSLFCALDETIGGRVDDFHHTTHIKHEERNKDNNCKHFKPKIITLWEVIKNTFSQW